MNTQATKKHSKYKSNTRTRATVDDKAYRTSICTPNGEVHWHFGATPVTARALAFSMYEQTRGEIGIPPEALIVNESVRKDVKRGEWYEVDSAAVFLKLSSGLAQHLNTFAQTRGGSLVPGWSQALRGSLSPLWCIFETGDAHLLDLFEEALDTIAGYPGEPKGIRTQAAKIFAAAKRLRRSL